MHQFEDMAGLGPIAYMQDVDTTPPPEDFFHFSRLYSAPTPAFTALPQDDADNDVDTHQESDARRQQEYWQLYAGQVPPAPGQNGGPS